MFSDDTKDVDQEIVNQLLNVESDKEDDMNSTMKELVLVRISCYMDLDIFKL